MTRTIHLFDPPTRFIAGTVGVPGQRTFFLQAQEDRRIVSVVLEKEQLRLLADRCDGLLDDLLKRGVPDIPASAPGDLDLEALSQPIEEEFRVGAMGLAWNPERGLITIEAHALGEDEEAETADVESDDPEGPDCLRVRITPLMARAFNARSLRLIGAGRQPCPLCQFPIDPDGHICPRANGYRRFA
ncbi:MAG: DUF3090 family protein [Candidatus Nanopelagicales bacterium]